MTHITEARAFAMGYDEAKGQYSGMTQKQRDIIFASERLQRAFNEGYNEAESEKYQAWNYGGI